jgi:uncharacterized protein
MPAGVGPQAHPSESDTKVTDCGSKAGRPGTGFGGAGVVGTAAVVAGTKSTLELGVEAGVVRGCVDEEHPATITTAKSAPKTRRGARNRRGIPHIVPSCALTGGPHANPRAPEIRRSGRPRVWNRSAASVDGNISTVQWTPRDELVLGGLEGVVVRPEGVQAVGVLVLSGSSGRVEVQRSRLLAAQGALAVSIRWFGGPGQPPGICEVPLETFTGVIDGMVAEGVEKVVLLGVSKGAEAALLLATLDSRIDAVIAISPSAYVWANLGPGLDGRTTPRRSSWTWQGTPVPFVPYDETWKEPSPPPVAYRSHYEQSLKTFPDKASEAAIAIERSKAQVLLIAGAADLLWPSDEFAKTLFQRRENKGLPTSMVIDASAGHRPIFPGEDAPPDSPDRLYGGTLEADKALGARAWPEVLRILDSTGQ